VDNLSEKYATFATGLLFAGIAGMVAIIPCCAARHIVICHSVMAPDRKTMLEAKE